ncbi:hypothetical protein M422DRAFT_268085 [Sphaerobolus stellatus SS14]|uniref:Uncharacterized protein n=1 Tax=Sphaerobolus stellatus (strain SS14) TaxID=990650 RepID=A0A0C9UYH7_SPHS4|nr:hypothetical protein M422DRAFT_268085 [Sphaerobolus stellatus SS14]
MFLEPLVMQANSPDLLFFDHDLERIIPFPYPMFNGTLIMPKGLRKYCETRRIMWECWCGLYTPEPAFIQFYGDHGCIYARCRTCGLNGPAPCRLLIKGTQRIAMGLMPMPSIPPPIRREIEAPHFDQHWFMPGPNAPGRRLTPLPQLPVSSPPPSEYLSTHRGHSSPGPAVAGPSRFPGAYEDDKEKIYEICRRCDTAYLVQAFNDHVSWDSRTAPTAAVPPPTQLPPSRPSSFVPVRPSSPPLPPRAATYIPPAATTLRSGHVAWPPVRLDPEVRTTRKARA